MQIQIVLNWPFLYISSGDDILFFNLDNMKLWLFKNYCLSWKIDNFLLFLNVRSWYLVDLDSLLFHFNQFFALYSLDVNLNNWLLVENWFISDNFNWHWNLYGNLHSLLNRNDFFNLYHPVNQSINVNLYGFFFHNFDNFLHHNLWVNFRLNFYDFLNLFILNFFNNLHNFLNLQNFSFNLNNFLTFLNIGYQSLHWNFYHFQYWRFNEDWNLY